jgi:hypothetical protein
MWPQCSSTTRSAWRKRGSPPACGKLPVMGKASRPRTPPEDGLFNVSTQSASFTLCTASPVAPPGTRGPLAKAVAAAVLKPTMSPWALASSRSTGMSRSSIMRTQVYKNFMSRGHAAGAPQTESFSSPGQVAWAHSSRRARSSSRFCSCSFLRPLLSSTSHRSDDLVALSGVMAGYTVPLTVITGPAAGAQARDRLQLKFQSSVVFCPGRAPLSADALQKWDGAPHVAGRASHQRIRYFPWLQGKFS